MSPKPSCLLLLVVVALAGCQGGTGSGTPTKPKPPPGATSALDPCEERLHDIAGALLSYYLLNKRLPDSLEPLRALADADRPIELTCPVSGKPYIYNRQGIPVYSEGAPTPALAGPQPAGRTMRLLVVYDPEPTHNGVRKAIAITPPSAGSLRAEVFAVEESVFKR